MTNETKTEEILSKIREVCPELMKLELGCEVVKKGALPEKVAHIHIQAKEENDIIVTAITRELWRRGDIEIIGSPVQLNHLLLALEKITGNTTQAYVTASEIVTIGQVDYADDGGTDNSWEVEYNLQKSVEDNLLTTPELTDFIYSLIVKES